MNTKFLLLSSLVLITLSTLTGCALSSKDQKSQIAGEMTYTGGSYTDYDAKKLSTLSGDIVLFFHADRCPTCIAAEKSFLASGIPAGLHIMKVDFDTSTELRKKYTVLTQTSFVQISSDGEMIQRWVGARDIQDIIDKIQSKKGEITSSTTKDTNVTATKSDVRMKAYFAGGCFRCMEGPFESLPGVIEVTNGYIGGDKKDAQYDIVSTGKTKHRESVEVVYDPAQISYDQLLEQYRRQIDPTDNGGQFADRGYQYTTAIYYNNSQEQALALQSKKKIEDSKKFGKAIAVQILTVVPFYPAESYHQDYYKTNAKDYKSYKKGSGREDFINTNRKEDTTMTQPKSNIVVSRKDKKSKTAEDLTSMQHKILFEGGTEPAFNNAYRDNHDAGIYVDVIDGTPLFSSTDKFDSGTGWPSFSRPIAESFVGEKKDTTAGMERTEVKSKTSNGHLGHIFDDGPQASGGMRYCINSAALEFIPLAELDAKGYSEYKKLFQ